MSNVPPDPHGGPERKPPDGRVSSFFLGIAFFAMLSGGVLYLIGWLYNAVWMLAFPALLAGALVFWAAFMFWTNNKRRPANPHSSIRKASNNAVMLGLFGLLLLGVSATVRTTFEYKWGRAETVTVSPPDTRSDAFGPNPTYRGSTWTKDGKSHTGTLHFATSEGGHLGPTVPARIVDGEAYTFAYADIKIVGTLGPYIALAQAPWLPERPILLSLMVLGAAWSGRRSGRAELAAADGV